MMRTVGRFHLLHGIAYHPSYAISVMYQCGLTLPDRSRLKEKGNPSQSNVVQDEKLVYYGQ